jgi:hypothetical protein
MAFKFETANERWREHKEAMGLWPKKQNPQQQATKQVAENSGSDLNPYGGQQWWEEKNRPLNEMKTISKNIENLIGALAADFEYGWDSYPNDWLPKQCVKIAERINASMDRYIAKYGAQQTQQADMPQQAPAPDQQNS